MEVKCHYCKSHPGTYKVGHKWFCGYHNSSKYTQVDSLTDMFKNCKVDCKVVLIAHKDQPAVKKPAVKKPAVKKPAVKKHDNKPAVIVFKVENSCKESCKEPLKPYKEVNGTYVISLCQSYLKTNRNKQCSHARLSGINCSYCQIHRYEHY